MVKMKLIFAAPLILSAFFCGGCGDSHYQAEKQFWHAEQKAKKLIESRCGNLSPEDYQDIIKGYKKVVEAAPVDPLSAKAHFLIVNLHTVQKNYVEAQNELKQIVQNFSADKKTASKAYFAMGKLWEMQGKFDEALEEYKKIIDFYPVSSLGLEMPLYMTQLCEKNREKITGGWAYSQMIRHYQALIDEYKGTSFEPYLQNYLIKAYLKGENWDDMLKIWDEQIKKKDDKTLLSASLSKARFYEEKEKNIPEAIKICEELIQKIPSDPSVSQIRLYMAQLRIKNGEMDKASDILSSLLKEFPKDQELAILCHLGLVSIDETRGRYTDAVEKLKKIREMFPDNPRSLAIPFQIYMNFEKMKDQANASRIMEETIREYSYRWKEEGKERIDLIIGKLLLRCYLQLKDWDRAAAHLQSFDERFPQTPYFLLLQAAIYSDKLELPLKARNVYNNILKRYSANKTITEAVEKLLKKLDTKEINADEGP